MDIPSAVYRETLASMREAIKALDQTNECSDCNGDGECSHASGRLQAAMNILEDLGIETAEPADDPRIAACPRETIVPCA